MATSAVLRESRMLPDSMARGVEGNSQIIGSSSGRNKKSRGSMGYWKNSLEAIITVLKAKRDYRDKPVDLLESRLDNVVYRMGFAASRKQARQLVRHNHFLVNNKKVNIPSYQVRPGDEIGAKDKSKKVAQIVEAMETVVRRGMPDWIDVDKEKVKGTLKALPNREDLTMPIQEQLIIELYSK